MSPSPTKACSTPDTSSLNQASPLDALLRAASSHETHDFETFLTSDYLLDLLPSRAQPSFSKIGEASYSEVFSVQRGKQELVIKIVPLLPVCQRQGTDEVPDCSSPEEVLREVEITKTLAALPNAGFVDIKGWVRNAWQRYVLLTHSSFIVQGAYPQRLIDEWYSFRELYGTSSIRPGMCAHSLSRSVTLR
jgi:serine/threonine-protein kinase haspin